MLNTVVKSGSFIGLITAFVINRKGGDDRHVDTIDGNDDFLFVPSREWVTLMRRYVSDISTPQRRTLEQNGVDFVKEAVLSAGPDVWDTGVSVGVELSLEPGIVPFDTPMAGYPSNETDKIVVKNIICYLRGKTKLVEKYFLWIARHVYCFLL